MNGRRRIFFSVVAIQLAFAHSAEARRLTAAQHLVSIYDLILDAHFEQAERVPNGAGDPSDCHRAKADPALLGLRVRTFCSALRTIAQEEGPKRCRHIAHRSPQRLPTILSA